MILYLDTNIVIYAIERNPVWGLKARARLAASRGAGDSHMVSDLTRMGCFVGPFKNGDARLEGQYRKFFGSARVQVVAVTPAVCERAARIRAATRFKALDALQLAAAVEHRADSFLTNDIRLGTFNGLPVEILS